MNTLAASLSLLHFLWQGALLGLVAALGLRALPARFRYVFSVLILSAMVLLPPATYLFLASRTQTVEAGNAFRVNPPRVDFSAGIPSPNQPDWATVIFVIWMAGAALMSVRAAGGWVVSRRRFRGGNPVQGSLKEAAARIAEQLGIRRMVRVVESTLVQTPCVFGTLKPLVLLPAAAVAGLPAAQLEAILAHELAHIARHDFLVNCLQFVVESMLFYHPAVWWLSRKIREEREMCCDETAAQLCGDRILYSRALLALEESRQPVDAFALAANGPGLQARIARLVGGEAPPAATSGPVNLALLSCMAALALMLAAGGIRAQEPANPYQHWLEQDVVYIIAPEEKRAFQSLGSDPERQQFIKQFWDRRDPTPGTEANEFKKEHYRRIAYVMERFQTPAKSGWATDRGRIYIVNGPPDEIEAHPAEKREEWRFHDGRQFEFRGDEYSLVRQQKAADKIVLESIQVAADVRGNELLQVRLAPYTGQPMSNDLMDRIRATTAQFDPTLMHVWGTSRGTGNTTVRISKGK